MAGMMPPSSVLWPLERPTKQVLGSGGASLADLGPHVNREESGKEGKAEFSLLVSLECLHRVGETATRPAPVRWP